MAGNMLWQIHKRRFNSTYGMQHVAALTFPDATRVHASSALQSERGLPNVERVLKEFESLLRAVVVEEPVSLNCSVVKKTLRELSLARINGSSRIFILGAELVRSASRSLKCRV
jgi:hypothetical protein